MLRAKSFPAHPESRLEIRLAVQGDRKLAGARDRSRFYLFNPEHDPAERKKREGYGRRGGRRYRDRDDDRPRARHNLEDFDATHYDDDEVARSIRASKSHSRTGSHSSVSSEDQRGVGVRRFGQSSAKELFPDRVTRRDLGKSGRLRDRSASPIDDRKGRLSRSDSASSNTANRLKAQMIKARLKESTSDAKELFPQKASIIHRRSDAFDAADATADLFANKMPVPFLDGSSDSPTQKKADLMSRITTPKLEDRITTGGPTVQGFNMRGVAHPQPSTGFSIKGVASGFGGKELFPGRTGQNSGKELFSEKLEGRGGRRQRAEDMFY
jgi:hypothetical protein